jgi:hypothetical protein
LLLFDRDDLDRDELVDLDRDELPDFLEPPRERPPLLDLDLAP